MSASTIWISFPVLGFQELISVISHIVAQIEDEMASCQFMSQS